MTKNYLVADVGGAHIRVACFPVGRQTPRVIQRIDTVGPDTPLDRLIHLLADVAPKNEEIAAIVVTAPGPLDPYEGVVFEAPNIPSWINQPLKKLNQERFNVPVAICNDADLAALERSATYLGTAIADYLHIFNPSMVIIGGGVSQSGAIYVDPVELQ